MLPVPHPSPVPQPPTHPDQPRPKPPHRSPQPPEPAALLVGEGGSESRRRSVGVTPHPARRPVRGPRSGRAARRGPRRRAPPPGSARTRPARECRPRSRPCRIRPGSGHPGTQGVQERLEALAGSKSPPRGRLHVVQPCSRPHCRVQGTTERKASNPTRAKPTSRPLPHPPIRPGSRLTTSRSSTQGHLAADAREGPPRGRSRHYRLSPRPRTAASKTSKNARNQDRRNISLGAPTPLSAPAPGPQPRTRDA